MRGRGLARWLKLWLALAPVACGLLFHAVWLAALGDLLVARDQLAPVDAIIVLAGNSPYRVQHASELYH
jgi:hypothetical protein